MIAWSIEAAKESSCFSQIVVSTDDQEIAEVARSWGAQVPFMRPAELADDFSGTTPVVAHAVQWLQAKGMEMEAVCCLYATAPFVEPADIRNGREQLDQTGSHRFVFTATSLCIAHSASFEIGSADWRGADVAAGKLQQA